jgi:hypothetical protein
MNRFGLFQESKWARCTVVKKEVPERESLIYWLVKLKRYLVIPYSPILKAVRNRC